MTKHKHKQLAMPIETTSKKSTEEKLELNGKTPCPICGNRYSHLPTCNHYTESSWTKYSGKAKEPRPSWTPDERELKYRSLLDDIVAGKAPHMRDAAGRAWARENLKVRDLFYMVAQNTVPYGSEMEEYYRKLSGAFGIRKLDYVDTEDNTHSYAMGYIIPHPDQPTEVPPVCFAAHLDTANYKKPGEPITWEWESSSLLRTDGKTLLGADDRAGVALLLYLIIHEVPGSYLFYFGEEVGRVGSEIHRKLESQLKESAFIKATKQMVCFDRRGTTSIITHQMSGRRGLSDEYAEALIAQFLKHSEGSDGKTLKMSKDAGGSYTDSATWFDHIPECTNISAGYDREHGTYESLNLAYLDRLGEVITRIEWNTLPIKRDPSKKEYRYSSRQPHQPTKATVGSKDYVASWRNFQKTLENLYLEYMDTGKLDKWKLYNIADDRPAVMRDLFVELAGNEPSVEVAEAIHAIAKKNGVKLTPWEDYPGWGFPFDDEEAAEKEMLEGWFVSGNNAEEWYTNGMYRVYPDKTVMVTEVRGGRTTVYPLHDQLFEHLPDDELEEIEHHLRLTHRLRSTKA